ncbi:MAG TPA: twin-arginine translocation signal domain-containing protein [Rhizomicrobium sp.]|nr:twin-arginine translocation signal domain-containing protein [Rhizomicrobium sp.]
MKRRAFIAAVTAAGAAMAAGLYRFSDLFVKHYAPTPYDDLLARLTDRQQAARLGAHVQGAFDLPARAAALRGTLNGKELTAVAAADLAAGRTLEVDGWVLPQTVALLSALAAKV